ncbi:hypothetical protein HC931_11700 [Candidatus Gracilibacteria bacterium]|jgi:hypothetical protein|nr:hypothetical protein [Candidatus Gracilibacteria bacterium]NJM89210.1 hypothetical protein [Hydrococcus sp. RU_2_2]NJP21851.1 hypothetical protein [Hydrococcus sp. CRU_1_1]NJQ98884.1 hypothetical protein [Hydrococcus sp. CSU_1_8]
MKEDNDLFKEQNLNKLQLSIYLLPIVGWVPSLWTLYLKPGNREQQSISRLSVTLNLFWLLSYIIFWLSATQSSEFLTLRLLYINGLLTSGYILTCLWLTIRLWQGKPVRLPGISRIASDLNRKK